MVYSIKGSSFLLKTPFSGSHPNFPSRVNLNGNHVPNAEKYDTVDHTLHEGRDPMCTQHNTELGTKQVLNLYLLNE